MASRPAALISVLTSGTFLRVERFNPEWFSLLSKLQREHFFILIDSDITHIA